MAHRHRSVRALLGASPAHAAAPRAARCSFWVRVRWRRADGLQARIDVDDEPGGPAATAPPRSRSPGRVRPRRAGRQSRRWPRALLPRPVRGRCAPARRTAPLRPKWGQRASTLHPSVAATGRIFLGAPLSAGTLPTLDVEVSENGSSTPGAARAKLVGVISSGGGRPAAGDLRPDPAARVLSPRAHPRRRTDALLVTPASCGAALGSSPSPPPRTAPPDRPLARPRSVRIAPAGSCRASFTLSATIAAPVLNRRCAAR